jgi:copper transport protein
MIRLVFSEQVVPELSQIALVTAGGDSTQLKVANDPHDVHVLLGAVAQPLSGPIKVVWRVLSADGHPVGGSFTFTVTAAPPNGASTASSTTPTAGTAGPGITSVASTKPGAATQNPTPEDKPVPIFASLFRGTGLGAMMAGIGLLFFGVTAGERRVLIPGAVVTGFVAVGALLLVAHGIAWLEHISPTGHVSGAFFSSVLGSTLGRVELIRVALAVLTLWAIALARHRKIALALGIACVAISGAVGHPAAIHPYVAIPSKSIHLLAGSMWIGGLLWLAWLFRADEAAFRAEAGRVSSAALIAVILILLSGLLQTVLFLNTPSDLFRYDYGKLVFNKMVGLVILIGFGVYNRYKLMPRIEAAESPRKMTRSVKLELAIITVVLLLSGFVAYEPTPPASQHAMAPVAEKSP